MFEDIVSIFSMASRTWITDNVETVKCEQINISNNYFSITPLSWGTTTRNSFERPRILLFRHHVNYNNEHSLHKRKDSYNGIHHFENRDHEHGPYVPRMLHSKRTHNNITESAEYRMNTDTFAVSCWWRKRWKRATKKNLSPPTITPSKQWRMSTTPSSGHIS